MMPLNQFEMMMQMKILSDSIDFISASVIRIRDNFIQNGFTKKQANDMAAHMVLNPSNTKEEKRP